MQAIKANKRQTFFDIALIGSGSATQANDIALANNCSITDSVPALVKMNTVIINTTIKNVLSVASSQIATGSDEYCFPNEFSFNFQ